MKASSIPSIILLILKEVGYVTAQSFFNPAYAKKYGYSYLYPNLYKKRDNYYSVFSRLRKRGFIKKEGDIYRLTSEGEKEAFFVVLDAYKNGYYKKDKKFNNENQKWDKKWRIIFFDIPEKKRRYRDELRVMLKAVGFKGFQKSIWIYPYKVPKFLKDILFEEGIKQYTRLITTSHMEFDKDLRNLFKL